MPGTLFHKAKNLLNGIALGALLVVYFSAPAFAVCSNPAGAAGTMGYFESENLYKYCDNTNWIDVGSKAGDVTNGLVAHWKFDETSGTTSTDIIGGRTATLSNGAQFAAGKYNNAVQSTDAVNDYVSTSAIDLSGANAVTVAFWTNRTWNSAGGKTLFEFSDNFNLYTDSFGFFPDDSTCSGIYVGLNGNVGFNTRCYTQPSSGVWHHIAAVFDKSQAAGGEVNLYIDGVLRTANSSPSNSNNTVTTFGNRALYMFSRGGTLEFNPGYIDDFRVYNRALTAAEIAKLAENDDATGLVLHWKLDENTGTTAGDSSTGGNPGTLRGGATWTSSGYTGSAVTFDGSDDCIDEGAVNLSGTNNITVSGWYKRNWGVGGGAYETLYEGSDNFNSSTTGYAIFPVGSGGGGPACPNYTLEVYLRGNVGHNGKCYNPPGDTNWHMLTAVYDKSQAAANEVQFYIDGVVQTAGSQPHNSNNTGNFGNDEFNFFTRNCNSTSAAEAVAGTGDDIRIYSRALTAGEIAALIDCTNPAGKKGMVNYNSTTHRYEYCNGTNWVQMDTQCASNNGGAGCTGGIAGTLRYNTTPNAYEYCEGDAWICVGNKCDHTPNAVTFDGTNDYLTIATDLTGLTDGNTVTGSFWIKRGALGSQTIFSTEGPRFSISFNGSNQLAFMGSSGGSPELNISATTTAITDTTTWHHVMFSFDLSSASYRHIYIDGVSQAVSGTYINGVIDYTRVGHAIGATTAGATKLNGDVADFLLDFNGYVDLSLAANRAKFYLSGNPIYLGCDGSAPLGYAPEIFLSGVTSSWETNDGTGGGFTENGALTDAATDP